MATLVKKRQDAADRAASIMNGAKSAERDLNADETKNVLELVTEIKGYDEEIKKINDAENAFKSIGQMPTGAELEKMAGDSSVSIGEHFAKHALDGMKSQRGTRFSLSAPEFSGGAKAASDPHLTSTTGAGLLLPQYDFNIVRNTRRRMTIADWLGSGTLTSNAITYFTEKPDSAIGGGFGTVAEGAAKPQINMPGYDPVTETLKKIAGWIKISDEMTEDLAFLVSEIENRLMYQLALFEENQLLNGNGTGTNVKGLLLRTGLGKLSAADNTDNLDAVFRALTKVQIDSNLDADGIVIHPLDYQKFRLSKDGNDQYFAGGPFAGQYGQGGILQDPPLWGKTTIVTTAIAQGKVLVGAGKQAATVYRKGGVRVEATNTEGNDFTNNMMTVRAEERITLAVRRAHAFVEVTLSDTAPVTEPAA